MGPEMRRRRGRLRLDILVAQLVRGRPQSSGGIEEDEMGRRATGMPICYALLALSAPGSQDAGPSVSDLLNQWLAVTRVRLGRGFFVVVAEAQT